MKKTLSLLLTLALILTLAACGPAAGQGGANSAPAPDEEVPVSTAPETPPADRPEDAAPQEDGTPAETDNGGKKILIAYFSATNNTENIANLLNEILEAYDMSEKTIVPFCTSASSPMGSSATNLHGLAGSATWLDGQRFSGGASRSAVESWVNGLNLNI